MKDTLATPFLPACHRVVWLHGSLALPYTIRKDANPLTMCIRRYLYA